ncbi:MAG TPA: alkaline phosphatase family protein [Ktedonobacteraceae bacterium]|nr:alkaline phosphatase family protein [Ktedonobacteraceae bacterium]
MLNVASINTVNGARTSANLARPLYDSYCFANIPATITHLLTGEGHSALPADVFAGLSAPFDKVVLFFIDAFGWRFFERFGDKYAPLKAFVQHGIVSKLTSQFPSTTAAHVTCIHTGLNVGQSGVYEWNYYEPLVDEIITPLLFSFAGDKARDTLKRAGVPPEAFFPSPTFYQQLQAQGIASSVFQSAAFTPSTPSDVYYKGATIFPYTNLDEGFTLLARALDPGIAGRDSSRPSYCFFYYNSIDSASHTYGPDSRELEQAVESFLTTFDKHLATLLRGQKGRALFMMTADHGQIAVNPGRTCYLNRHIPGIDSYLRTNRRGQLLVPAGSARDMFLYVKPERLDEAVALLQHRLDGIARVYRVQEFIDQGYFGTTAPSREFMARAGNVLILPEPYQTVWWHEYGKFAMNFAGHHGGLTPAEMEIPLFVLPC